MTESNPKPTWVKLNPKELEELIIEISKEEKNPAKIGIILRDKHTIPKSKLLGIKIKKVLKENKIQLILDNKVVSNKIEKLKKHIGSHKHDHSASRSLTKNLWAIRRLNKFN